MPTAQITQFGRSDAAQVTAVLLGQNGGTARRGRTWIKHGV